MTRHMVAQHVQMFCQDILFEALLSPPIIPSLACPITAPAVANYPKDGRFRPAQLSRRAMADPTVPDADLSVAAPAQASTLSHRGSEDLTNMLQQAVSALNDDDLLLSGKSSARWAPCKWARAGTAASACCALLVQALAQAEQTVPCPSAPCTHDVFPAASRVWRRD